MKSIIMSGESVCGILDGSKTQTRRVLKPQPEFIQCSSRWVWNLPKRCRKKGCCTKVYTASREWHEYAPKDAFPFQVGDLLRVKETWGCPESDHPKCENGRKPQDGDRLVYKSNPADDYQWSRCDLGVWSGWRSPMFMPSWASRITLEVVSVKVELLQDISEADALAEGCEPDHEIICGVSHQTISAKQNYAGLWDQINAKRGCSWESNPWVIALEFRQVIK